MGFPGLSIWAFKTNMKLTYAIIKNISHASLAVNMLNEEQKQHCQAILVFLYHNGYWKFDNMCSFHLSDNSNFISKELDYHKDIIN